jgi:hypothetical protein
MLAYRLDASCLYPGLYQGSAPPVGPLLCASGINVVVLCALEWQPPKYVANPCQQIMGYDGKSPPYPGVEVVYAPNDDDFCEAPSREILQTTIKAASYVAQQIRQGKSALVTCWAGRNRSGLVSAIALHRLTGLPGAECAKMVQKVRPKALGNPQFIALLSRIQGVPPQPGVQDTA